MAKLTILHEALQEEAQEVEKALKEVYGLKSKLINKNLEGLFPVIPEFNGYFPLGWHGIDFASSFGNAVLILTPRDLYGDNKSKEDDWVFGGAYHGNELGKDLCVSIISNARMKRYNSQPSEIIEVPKPLYFKRICTTAVHEIGHDVVKASHLKQAKLVNAKTGYEFELGPHCDDNKCVMYEIIDINSPPKEQSYLLLGEEKKYDAGLDETIKRMYPTWLCEKCKASVKIDNKYEN